MFCTLTFAQENGKDISDRIFQGCGQPALGRMRRSVDGETLLGANGIEDHPHLITALKRQLPVLSLIAEASDADSQFTFDEDDGAEDSGDVTDESDKRISKRSAGGSGAGDSTSRELKYEPLQFSDGDVQFTNSNGPPLIPALSPSGSIDSNGGGGGGRANRRKNKNGRKPTADQDEQDNQEPMIDRLVKDIRQKVRDSKRFWAQLPYMLCNNEDIAEQDQNDASCWNGTAVNR